MTMALASPSLSFCICKMGQYLLPYYFFCNQSHQTAGLTQPTQAPLSPSSAGPSGSSFSRVGGGWWVGSTSSTQVLCPQGWPGPV